MKKKIVYSEPAEYFPEELRRKYKLGEFAETSDENQGTNEKGTVGMKMPDDEELEKLFESLDRKTARLIDNQHTPTKRTTKKSTKTVVDCGGIKSIDPIKPSRK